MATAPGCHLFSSSTGTCLRAHCIRGREGVPPEKVALGSLPKSEQPDVLSVSLQVAHFLQSQKAYKGNHFHHGRAYQKLTYRDLIFVGEILPEELINFLTVGSLNLDIDLSYSYM